MASSPVSIEPAASPDSVEGSLNYLGAMNESPTTYAYTPPDGRPDSNLRFAPHSMRINNGRPLIGQLSLDKQGFELIRHETAVKNFYNDE